jgi:hypothetical protein
MSDKCTATLPHQRVQTCVPSVVTEDKCTLIDCVYKSVKVTTTTFADCAKSITIMDGTTILAADTKLFACKDPTPVISACEKPPVDAPATTCGADATVKAADLLSQAVHTAPGTALLVKLCPADPEFDREFAVLCAPDGTKVAVQNITPVDAPLGTAPTFEAWTLAGTAYIGDIALLSDCGAEKIDVTAAQWFCANGTPISRTDFWDVFSAPQALLGSMWQDAAGNIVPAPAAGTFVVGDCSCVNLTAAQRGIQSTW